MDDQTLLSDLCKICTIHVPKYCCPRCKSRTCSLACYKRHKAWSQCNGKRDPAAYVKINQLATPAGIDHDYNFLSGIERSFNAADHDAEDRGISLEPGGGKEPAQGSNLQKSLDAVGVVVKRMPKGMSRQKTNRTAWHPKQKCVVWTVEWVRPDGSRETAQCRDNMALAEAYAQLPGAKQSKKRKRASDARTPAAKPAANGAQDPRSIEAKASPITTNGATQATKDTSTLPNSNTPTTTNPSNTTPLPSKTTNLQPTLTSPTPQTLAQPPQPLHYYLHIPITPSKHALLSPLPPTTTLSRALRNRTIVEYPTIHVLLHPPEALPPHYQLEELKIQEVAEEAGHTFAAGSGKLAEVDGRHQKGAREGGGANGGGGGGAADQGFEAANVLKLLQRDIEAVSRAL